MCKGKMFNDPLFPFIPTTPCNNLSVICWMGFPGGLVVKNPPVSAGDSDLILGSGRSPGEGNGNKLQYSCLGYHMDRGACRLQSMGSQSWTQ